MARSFIDTVGGLRRGVLSGELTEKLAELVRKVSESGKAGSLSLTLKVKPASRARGAFVVLAEVETKLPKDLPDETLMFGTPEGSLLNDDPAQTKLDLRVAPAAPAQALSVPAAPEAGELKTVAQQ